MDTIRNKKILSNKIRYGALETIADLGFGHVGGSMSICEVLGVLYGGEMKYDTKNPDTPDKDILIVSKGHAGPAVYAALSAVGFFEKDLLKTMNRPGTSLPSHCDRNLTRGVDMTTGSLGQGLSIGLGAALGKRIDCKDNYVFVIIGDGELQEGQNWEALMTAGQMKMSNLIVFLDWNKYQMNGTIESINHLKDIAETIENFNWHTQQVNGHDVEAIDNAVKCAKKEKKRPSFIVLDTIKGNGCDFALSQDVCHSIVFDRGKIQGDLDRIESEIELLQGEKGE